MTSHRASGGVSLATAVPGRRLLAARSGLRLPGMMILAAIGGAVAVGCEVPTESGVEAPEDPARRPVLVVFRDGEPDPTCDEIPGCQTKFIQPANGWACQCEIEGITAKVQGGQGIPNDPPSWSEPPGWPWHWNLWPTPPGMGGPPPPGDPSEWCDPNSITGCAEHKATLTCTTPVRRGEEGTCVFEVDPPSALQSINQWRFQGESGSTVTSDHKGMTWKGVFVESGVVSVFYQAEDRELRPEVRVNVRPREGGTWTQAHWESKITLAADQGSAGCARQPRMEFDSLNLLQVGWVQAKSAVSKPCNGQHLEPAEDWPFTQEGVVTTMVSDNGPNDGLWYVTDVSYKWEAASKVHPNAEPGGTPYALADILGQAAACRTALGIPDSMPVTVNFYTFNNQCMGVSDWGGFLTAVRTHERQHFLQADTVLRQPGMNIYANVESVVRKDREEFEMALYQKWRDVHNPAKARGSLEPTGHWTGQFWAWAEAAAQWFRQTNPVNF